jgi:phosphate acetyltransferase
MDANHPTSPKKGIFIASTGQNVGKTTTCLGILSGLKKRYKNVGFMKPVGQEHVEAELGLHVDKDVVLFKEHFCLASPYKEMSPILFPQGFTRKYLDGELQENHLKNEILSSFSQISAQNSFTVVEGTGHISVGSIVDMNNAQVANLLDLPVILIASGGLGSAFDELAMNKAMCEKYGAKVIGVVLNRVLPDKRDMIIQYMNKALQRWQIPLLGCIPYAPFLSAPAMKDYASLFDMPLLTGHKHEMRHFEHIRLIATSVDSYRKQILPRQLLITPTNREDIILATLSKYWDTKIANPEEDLRSGMILTGSTPPTGHLLEQIRQADIPMLYTPVTSDTAMKMIASFTAKIRKEDVAKIEQAIALVEAHFNFDLLDQIFSKN